MSVTIFSVCHDTQRAGGGIELHASQLGFYDVPGIGPAGREAREYAVCRVPDVVIDKVYMGGDAPDGQFYRLDQLPGRQFAETLVQSCQIGGGAVAVAAGDEPTPEELEAARERYIRWLDSKLKVGQEEWAQSRNPGRIEHFARVAAVVLGASVEWGAPSVGTLRKRCDNCDEMVSQKAVYCPKCSYPFDLAAAAAAGNAQAIRALEMQTAPEMEPEPAVAAAGGKGSRR